MNDQRSAQRSRPQGQPRTPEQRRRAQAAKRRRQQQNRRFRRFLLCHQIILVLICLAIGYFLGLRAGRNDVTAPEVPTDPPAATNGAVSEDILTPQEPGDTTAPTILGVNKLSVFVGSTVAYRSGILVTDDVDPNPKLTIDSSFVNLSAPGTYQLTFDGKGTANTYRPLLYIGINQWSKVYGEHFLKNFGFGEEWKTATVQFTVPASAANSSTGLAPVAVALWSSNASYGPETEMQLDNFAVRRLFSVTTELNNAALAAELHTVLPGRSYVNTITANVQANSSSVSRYSLDSEIIRPMDIFGTVSTSAAMPAFQPRLRALAQAVRKKGRTEGIQIRRSLVQRLRRKTCAISNSWGSASRMPPLTPLQITGRAIMQQISTGT